MLMIELRIADALECVESSRESPLASLRFEYCEATCTACQALGTIKVVADTCDLGQILEPCRCNLLHMPYVALTISNATTYDHGISNLDVLFSCKIITGAILGGFRMSYRRIYFPSPYVHHDYDYDYDSVKITITITITTWLRSRLRLRLRLS
eukprot:1128568-Amorphochlora_amoeboformis.AAC.1